MTLVSRTRERVLDTVTETEDYRNQVWNGGSCTVQPPPLWSDTFHSDVVVVNQKTEKVTDVVTENFYSLRNKGVIINNPFYKEAVELYRPLLEVDGTAHLEKYYCTPPKWTDQLFQEVGGKTSTARLSWSNGFWCTPPDLSDDIDQATSLAVSEAWANISSDQIYALVSLLESEKTMIGLIDSGKRMYKFLRNVKRLQLSGLKRQLGKLESKQAKRAWKQIKDEFTLDALADRYMEIRYGWRPLYFDVLGATNALKAEFKHLRQTFRGSEAFTSSGIASSTARHLTQPWAGGDLTLAQSWTVDVKVRAGVLCDVNLSHMDPWGFSKIPESILDLCPFSFVVDWFFNISDTLSSWTPDLGFTALASWVKVQKTETLMSVLGGVTPYLESIAYPSARENTYTASMKEAWKITQTTTRTPDPRRDILPSAKLRLNAAKLTDLAIMCKNLVFGGSYPLKSRNLRL